MNRRRRPYAVLLQLAFVATLLMALAPLFSRWQQAHGDPVMLMPGGMAHAMPAQPVDDVHAHGAAHEAMAHQGMHHAQMHHEGMHHDGMHHAGMHHAGMHDMAAAAAVADGRAVTTPPAAPPIDPHAGHGEACEYCMMASRLMPWLAVLLVLLPALPGISPPVLRTVATPRSLRWPAHAARGPPFHA